MKILCAHCDFAPASLALLNLKGYALADQGLRDLEFRTVQGFPPEDPEDWIERVMDAASDFQPDLIALSLYVWSRYRMYEATRRLRAAFPRVPVIWGGPDVSDEAYARELMTLHPGATIIVRDEGERTFRNLLHHFQGTGRPLGEITGITYRQDGEIRETGKVEYLENLDEIPSILDLPEIQAIIDKVDVFALETFRGCYMGCAYCYWGGTTRRTFSSDRVYSDLGRILSHRNIKKIWFFDSMFGFKKKNAKDLLRFIVANKAPDQCVTFFPNLDFLDEELCQLMKEAGVYIEAGIQTINEEAYEYLNRKWDRKFLDSKIPLLEKYGLRANAQQLILGLPGDNLAGFRKSVDYAFSTRPESIQIFPFSVLPATGYWRRKEEFKIKHEGEYRIVYDSTTFPEDEMVAAGIIMAGTKWFEHYPGFATQLVRLLGVAPSDLFLEIGRTFMAEAWHLEDTPETRPRVRKALLCQAFSAEEVKILRDPGLLRRTFLRAYGDRGLEGPFEELFRLEAFLNSRDVLDARIMPDDVVEEAVAAWREHPGALSVMAAKFNVFDAESWTPEGGFDDPIEFAAYPVEGPKDFFGKDLPRYRIIVLGSPGVRHPALR